MRLPDSYDPYRGYPPKADAKIESFANYRDNLHKTFRFTKGNVARLAFFGLFIPFVVFTTTTYQLERPFQRMGYQPEQPSMNVFGFAGPSKRPRIYNAADIKE